MQNKDFEQTQREPKGTKGNQREPKGTKGNQREPKGTKGNQRAVYKQDLYRYNGNSSFKYLLKHLFLTPGYTYTFFLRKAQNSHNKIFKLFYTGILKIISMIYHFQIPIQTKIGKGFYIGHFGSIVINPKAVIGENVNIHQGVTIGQTNRGQKKGVPIIGSRVWIGTNSVIVGNIIIGSNVLIAPNSYVNIDVPDNSIVMGNPAIIKLNPNATIDYINNIV